MKSAVFGFIITVIIILVLLFGWTSRTNTPNSGAVVLEIQKLNRLETASISIEKIIDAGTKGNVFSDILFGDRILLIAHGEVIAGFDFSKLYKNSVKISGTSLEITLPAPRLLSSKLDNDQTRVYDRESGLLTKGNKNLESEARKTAEVTIIEAACKANILNTASENGRKQLTALFKALGFQTITIIIPEGKCL